MTDTTSSISDLIEISEDGTAFYEEAAQKVKDKKVSTLFARLAKAKSELAAELSAEVKPAPKSKKPAKKPASSLVELSKVYTGMRKQWPDSPVERFTRIESGTGERKASTRKRLRRPQLRNGEAGMTRRCGHMGCEPGGKFRHDSVSSLPSC